MDKRKGYKRKAFKHREDLAGEHSISDIGQIILLILFLSGLLVDRLILHFSDFLAQMIPIYPRVILSLPFFILSFILARSGLKTVFGDQREELLIIKTGVFAVVRHPIYLGSILLYLALIFISLSIVAFCIWIIIILFYYFISRYEERLLIDRLGSQYEEYMNEVPMFIPKPFKDKRK
jgi:protein-S-isoprenylcysteine O-methyltransferase Ste14